VNLGLTNRVAVVTGGSEGIRCRQCAGEHGLHWLDQERPEPQPGRGRSCRRRGCHYRGVLRQHVQGGPVLRVGSAREAGDLTGFLTSDRASYISGTAFNMDGGAAPVV
jgi:NAD(P)-dependent dehydrogenase (short-subunit alcohol dehydrogenase family)